MALSIPFLVFNLPTCLMPCAFRAKLNIFHYSRYGRLQIVMTAQDRIAPIGDGDLHWQLVMLFLAHT